MSKNLTVAVPDYYKQSKEANTFNDFTDLFIPEKGGILGLWNLSQLKNISAKDALALKRDSQVKRILMTQQPCKSIRVQREGEEFNIDPEGHVTRVESELWTKNVITDIGATAMLKNTWFSSGSQIGIFAYIAIAQGAGPTTLTTALTNGQTTVTSLAVQALPAAIPANATIVMGYGTSQTQTVTVTGAGAALGATSIPTVSFTANAAYAIGTNVVPNPLVTDNPSALTNAAYSTTGATTWTYSGTGAGSRQVVIAFTFTTSTTAGNYTESFTTNASPVTGAAQCASHLIFPAQVINNQTQLAIQLTEKC